MTAPFATPVLPMEWTPEVVSRFWDWQSRFPEAYFANRYGRALLQQVVRLVPPPARLLDYACGPGFMIRPSLAAGYRVTACDISPESVERANEQGAGHAGFEGAFTLGDLHSQAGSFDVAIMTEVVEHVDDPTLDAILASVAHFLKPGGMLLVTTPNDEDLSASTVYCPCCSREFHRWQHVRSWTRSSLSARLASAGYAVTAGGATDFGLALEPNVLRRTLRLWRNAARGAKPPHLWVAARSPAS